jgi:hypothetical protein
MKDRTSLMMAISGATGFSFFLIANFTNLFAGAAVMAGCVQIAVNLFVFLTWGKAFLQRTGQRKWFAFCGVIVPVVMASITLSRVLIPWAVRSLT